MSSALLVEVNWNKDIRRPINEKLACFCVEKSSESLTWARHVAGCMHLSNEKLEADNSIDDDDKQDQKGNVQQRDHGFNDGVQHHL